MVRVALLAIAAVAADPYEVVDRVVAVVDDDPILLSDVRRGLAIGLIGDGGAVAGTPGRAALDRLIEYRLRLHEVERADVEIAEDAVTGQVERVLARWPQREAALSELGLDRDELRALVRRQLEVLRYVEERLGARVYVTLEDVRRHYEDVAVPQWRGAGVEVPELEDVREEIRAVLRAERLNEEVAAWTERLRRQADVIDLLAAETELLPVRRTRE